MFRFSSLFAGATLLTGLGLTTTATAATAATAPNPTDTIQIKLSDGASMTLFVKNQEELRKLRAYKMDSLLSLLDRYITQAQNVSKAAGDAGRTTMEFYPARDLNNPSAPEKLRVVVYNEKNRPATTTTRVDVGHGITIRVDDGASGQSTTQVRINGTGVKVTETADGDTKVKIGRQAVVDDSIAEIGQQRHDEEHTNGYFVLGFGLNTLTDAGRAGVVGDPTASVPVTLRNWGSRYVHLGYMADTRILKAPRSAPFVRYGVQVAFNNYMLEGNKQWANEGDVTKIGIAPDGRNLQKTKLATSTIQIPVLLGFRLHTQKGKEALTVAAGGFAGYRINSRTKLKFEQDGNTKKIKDRGAYNLEDFQYGLIGSISVFGQELFATYNLNELFRKDRGPQGNVLAFGFTLIGNEHNLKSDKYRTAKRYPGVAMR
ncbi:MAG: outer membrane beta-barrel protein [Hymenobacteraceae bacterium]|nr:outer membrane beta-barrel protein [Hymenobacteraceae bacterium]